MKHVDEYRNGRLARALAQRLAREADPDTDYRFMEFCGGHTHAIARYGIEDLLPDNVRLIHGPGCPVCVLPPSRIDAAIRLARRAEVTLCAYGDLMRVPGAQGASLLRAKAAGADIRLVYSPVDAVRLAEATPSRAVVFFAIGFETTAPATALAVRQAAAKKLTNFSVFCNHVLTPAAMRAILESGTASGGVRLDGFIGPAHVSTVIGTASYAFVAEEFAKPVAIAGFEPLDVMQAALMLIRQINEGRHDVENQYARAVRPGGNACAQADVAAVFELREAFDWRGLGAVPQSGLRLNPAYAALDAEHRFDLPDMPVRENPACQCGAILRGVTEPVACKLFGTVCTPDTPIGPCMVSAEGACAAHWTYGRFRHSVRHIS